MEILDTQEVRGFTLFPLTHGRGSFSGEPHMGSHAWPSMNSSVLAMVEDQKVAPLLDAVREAVKPLVFFKTMPYARIELAQLGNDAGIIGAAMLGR